GGARPIPRPPRCLGPPRSCPGRSGAASVAPRPPLRHFRPATPVVKPIRLGSGAEFDLIRRFLERSRPPGKDVLVGPGDDCTVLEAGRLAVSADLSIEDVHFRRAWITPEEVGYRAAMASLSDLAAMAAEP